MGCLLAGAVSVVAPVARAGGDFVDLAAAHGRLWFVGPVGVRGLNQSTGQVVAQPSLVRAPYPLSVTVAGGAAWVASVENGYVWGTLSRIDERSGKVRVVWRKQGSSVQFVAAGAGSVWALIGSKAGTRVARFSATGRLVAVWRIAAAARIAADDRGCWIAAGRWLLQISASGHLRHVLRGPFGGVATGGGAVWLPRAASVVRLDERTGAVRTLATGALALGGYQHDLAAGDGALWALNHGGRTRSSLLRIDPRTGRSTGLVSLRGSADALVVRPGAIWVATVTGPAGKPASGYEVLRIDPRTLRRGLLIAVP